MCLLSLNFRGKVALFNCFAMVQGSMYPRLDLKMIPEVGRVWVPTDTAHVMSPGHSF